MSPQVPSRSIPEPIKRAVRQRCGFGCVICGLPLYEYEHMLGWAVVQRHEAHEITLLCDQHHREKTSGLLPLDVVRKANDDPHNLRTGVSKPYDLHFEGSDCEIEIGGNRFTSVANIEGERRIMAALVMDNQPIVGFILEDQHLLLFLNVFDECNNFVFGVAENQVRHTSTAWDIRLVGRRLEVREGAGRFLLDIEFQPPSRVAISRGRFLRNGIEVIVRPDSVTISNTGMVISGCHADRSLGGIVVGVQDHIQSAMFRVEDVPRYRVLQ